MALKIVIVDAHAILRQGLELLIGRDTDIEIVGQASNGREAITLCRAVEPDFVIMEVSMPELNGIEASKQILSENPYIKILAFSAHYDTRFIIDMLKAGVHGYILKDCLSEELITAIRSIMSGKKYLCSTVTGIVIDDYIQCASRSGRERLDGLSDRDCELLQLLVEGKTSKVAARLLHISAKTVDARRREIMNKLDVDNMVDLTKLAIREGLTSVEF